MLRVLPPFPDPPPNVTSFRLMPWWPVSFALYLSGSKPQDNLGHIVDGNVCIPPCALVAARTMVHCHDIVWIRYIRWLDFVS